MTETYQLSNGLTVILEPINHLESISYELLIPGGISHDQEDQIGMSLVLPELTARGTENYTSRELSSAFDASGIRHGEGAGMEHFSYRGSCLSEKIDVAFNLTAEMVLKPTLPEGEIPNIQSLLVQDIRSLADQPSRRVSVEMASRYYPAPYNRPGMGTETGISKASVSTLRNLWQNFYRPSNSILSIGGKFVNSDIKAIIEKYFGSWTGKGQERIPYGTFPSMHKEHIHYEGAQLQIAFAFPSAPFQDPDYYTAKLATGILSGGMFGRLFIDVREKRGLCYSVYARHSATKEYGQVLAYSGTTPDRAHETLEVMLEVFKTMHGTITQEELDRARANVLSGLIMSEESPASRVSSNSTDWWLARKLRTIDEIKQGLKSVTIKQIDRYLERFPVEKVMLVTLGSRDITGDVKHV